MYPISIDNLFSNKYFQLCHWFNAKKQPVYGARTELHVLKKKNGTCIIKHSTLTVYIIKAQATRYW